MASDVETANSALQKLGQDRIASLSDDSPAARSCNVAIFRIRDKLLRGRNAWNFAIVRAQLAASVTAPLFGKANAFPLPSDFLRLLPLDPVDNVNTDDRQIESHGSTRAIVTDEDAPLDIRYVRRVTDPNEMDSLFLELWATDLALDICLDVTGSNTKKEALRADRKAILEEAKAVNAYESVAPVPPTDPWITVRA